MAWTDERLDDRFDRIDSELHDLRQDMREMRTELRGEMGSLRAELRGEIERLRLAMITVGGSGFLGLIAAVLVTG